MLKASAAALVSFEQIVAASHRIKGHVKNTPIQFSARLQKMIGAEVYLKLENMQHTGAYKERGALNKLKTLSDKEKKAGVYAASAGNHAQGLAFHSGRLGLKSTIFMPIGTPTIKVSRTQDYGADVKLIGNNYDDAFDACMEEVKRTGGTLVHPFDDPMVIAGQGTMALEMLTQIQDLDVILVPVGGGGMISGIATVCKELNPKIRVIGVEPAKIPTMALAMQGDLSVHAPVTTIADGINVRKVGSITSAICKELVDEWVSVTDEEICRAILFLLEGEKIVAEGAGAAGVAALIANKVGDVRGKKVATIVCGGNIDVNVISLVIESGLIDTGRRVRMSLNLPDRPGSLTSLVQHISTFNANVVSIHHERTRMASYGSARVVLTLDVKGFDHSKDILTKLTDLYNTHVKIES